MITKMTSTEKELMKTMVQNLIKRHAKRLKVSEHTLAKIFAGATVEIYQEKPFTTAIIKRSVGGRHIRGVGFAKYNFNDAKLGDKYAWNETNGKLKALSRAYHSFIAMMVEKKVLHTQKSRVKVQAVVEPETSEVPDEVKA